MAQNAINLASQATRALTICDWSYQDCEEFLDDLEKEFKKVNKALDTYSPMECEPGVKRRMADCRLCLEAARFEAEKVVTRLLRDHEAWGQLSREAGQKRRHQLPEWSLEFEWGPTTPPRVPSWSASGTCVRMGMMLVWGCQRRTGLVPKKAPKREDTPRARPRVQTESRG
jgi:hypothetical protein